MENMELFILYHQYYYCWCPGDAMWQGISSHGIDLNLQEHVESMVSGPDGLTHYVPMFTSQIWVKLVIIDKWYGSLDQWFVARLE